MQQCCFLISFFTALPADILRYPFHLQTSHCLYCWSTPTAAVSSRGSLTLHCHHLQPETGAGWYPVRPSVTPWLHPTGNYRSQGEGLDFVCGYHTQGIALSACQIRPSALTEEFGAPAFLFPLNLSIFQSNKEKERKAGK